MKIESMQKVYKTVETIVEKELKFGLQCIFQTSKKLFRRVLQFIIR